MSIPTQWEVTDRVVGESDVAWHRPFTNCEVRCELLQVLDDAALADGLSAMCSLECS